MPDTSSVVSVLICIALKMSEQRHRGPDLSASCRAALIHLCGGHTSTLQCGQGLDHSARPRPQNACVRL